MQESSDIENHGAHWHEVEDSRCNDLKTPLDKTIDRIGMGCYQWILLVLCGFGWMADNMWIQVVTIILPRVQQHYSVPHSYIGALSSSMYAGMMLGAVGWGTCADLMGRSVPFNGTIFFTAVFGILASFTDSFWGLCVYLFFLGSAIGGSMPTDGTLIFENMPSGRQYLVTALCVFFSLGSALSALVSFFILPGRSCSPNQPCSPSTENSGWKLVLVCHGLITLSMFFARSLLFPLRESPRYLVHAGRIQEALHSLQFISRFNGVDIDISLEDITDRKMFGSRALSDRAGECTPFLPSAQEACLNCSDNDRENYQSVHQSSNPLQVGPHLSVTPVDEYHPRRDSMINIGGSSSSFLVALPDETKHQSTFTPNPSSHHSGSSGSQASSITSVKIKTQFGGVLPAQITDSLVIWLRHIGMLLGPECHKTTLLVWSVWILLAVAFTMFNVYYPKLLEMTSGEDSTSPTQLEDNLWDVVIFTLGGCPGSLLGAYMVHSALGRRWSLAGTTLLTALFTTAFVPVKTEFLVHVTSVGINVSSTMMYATLYGWTPELFDAKVRGTGFGTASGLSRVGGMIAPILGGILLSIDRSLPVYASALVYFVATIRILLLHETAGSSGGGALPLGH